MMLDVTIKFQDAFEKLDNEVSGYMSIFFFMKVPNY